MRSEAQSKIILFDPESEVVTIDVGIESQFVDPAVLPPLRVMAGEVFRSNLNYRGDDSRFCYKHWRGSRLCRL
jgi:hypothetical protein